MTAEQQINAWIKLLQQNYLLPAEINVVASLVGNLQQDDISSLICYLVFNLQEEISIDKRVPYILQRLGYNLQTLHDVPNLQEFAFRLAHAIDLATKNQELLPPFLYIEGADLEVYTRPDVPYDRECEDAAIRVRLDDAEQDAGAAALVVQEMQSEAAKTIQEELLQEIQLLNYENTRLQEKAQLFEQVREYLLLQFQIDIQAGDGLDFTALDDVGARVRINEAEVELDAAKMRNPNYVAQLQAQLQAQLDCSPFSVEIVTQETPDSVYHAKRAADAADAAADAQKTIKQLKSRIEQLSQELAILKERSAINGTERASSNMNRPRRGEDSDDFEAFAQPAEPAQVTISAEPDFLMFLAQKLDRIAQQNGLKYAPTEPAEDALLTRIDLIVLHLRYSAARQAPAGTPKNVQTDPVTQHKVVQDSYVARSAVRTQTDKGQTATLYLQLAKARSVIQENVKMRLELENEIQNLQTQLEGAYKRCRASEIAYESERLASKRVKVVDKYGLDRLNQELADVRKLALLKGLKK